MLIYLVIGFAGAAGALLRYAVSLYFGTFSADPFPFATLVTNFLGAFLLGWFSTWVSSKKSFPVAVRLGFGIGLIGSFTTFSTFSMETVQLLSDEMYISAFVYASLSLFGGLLMAWCGCLAARWQVKINTGRV